MLTVSEGSAVSEAASLRPLLRTGAAMARHALRRDHWSLRWRLDSNSSGDPWERIATGGWHEHDPPGSGCADPFPWRRDGRAYVFFEHVPEPGADGVIAVSELLPDGSASPPEVCLREPHHLSYPFLIEEGGETLMIPETLAARSVSLYSATDFPHGWRREHVLLEGIDSVDPTVHFDGTTYWMWVAVVNEVGSAADEAHLFHADDLRGPWSPHPANPVVSDIRTARPAGTPFVHEGRLIRPAQDCSGRYGRRLVFNEVTELSATRYSERRVTTVDPFERGTVGLHTFNSRDGVEVVDLCRSLVKSPRAMLGRG